MADRPVTTTVVPEPETVIGVRGSRAVDDDGVGLAVAGVAAERAREVEVHVGDAGAGQVVDGERVGAAEGGDVDLLDAVDVHGHVADVAEQPQPGAVGRQVDVLVDVGAVELQGVGAALALDHVAAVAGVPHERVVAVAQEGHVVAATADDGVVAVAADQHVVAVAAGDGVIARAAVDGQPDHTGGQSGGGDRVVAAEGVHDELVVGPFGALDRSPWPADRPRCNWSRCP